MVAAKRQERGKDHENRTKEGPRTRVRTSGKTNSTLGWPNLHRAGSGGGEKNIKRPTRLLHPLDSPGKNTGAGCHFLLQCRKVKSERDRKSVV